MRRQSPETPDMHEKLRFPDYCEFLVLADENEHRIWILHVKIHEFKDYTFQKRRLSKIIPKPLNNHFSNICFSQSEKSSKTTHSSGKPATDVGCEVVQHAHTLSKMLYNIRPRPYKIKTLILPNQPKSCISSPNTDQHFMQHDQVVQQVGYGLL